MFRAIVLLAVTILMLASPQAQAAKDLRLGSPAAFPNHVSVAPGASTQWIVSFSNAGDVASPVGQTYLIYSENDLQPIDEFDIGLAAGQACSGFQPQAGLAEYEFTVAPIAPGANVQCTFAVQRTAASRSDLLLTFVQADIEFTPGNYLDIMLGAPVTTALTVENFPASEQQGTTVQRVRVTFANNGPYALEQPRFGHCGDGVAFEVVTNFPGACELTDGPSVGICFIGGATYRFPGSVAAGGNASCLLELRRPSNSPADPGVPLSLDSSSANTAGGVSRVMQLGSAVLQLGAAPGTVQARHTIPAWDVRGMLLLLVGILVAGIAACARRG